MSKKKTTAATTLQPTYCTRGDLAGTVVDGRAIQSQGADADQAAIQTAADAMAEALYPAPNPVTDKPVALALKWANVIGAAEILHTGALGSGFAAALQSRNLSLSTTAQDLADIESSIDA